LSGRGLCDELITRPEESYRLWCVVACDLETSWMRRPCPTGGCRSLIRRWKEVRIRKKLLVHYKIKLSHSHNDFVNYIEFHIILLRNFLFEPNSSTKNRDQKTCSVLDQNGATSMASYNDYSFRDTTPRNWHIPTRLQGVTPRKKLL
jgi:hypothetical protein